MTGPYTRYETNLTPDLTNALDVVFFEPQNQDFMPLLSDSVYLRWPVGEPKSFTLAVDYMQVRLGSSNSQGQNSYLGPIHACKL